MAGKTKVRFAVQCNKHGTNYRDLFKAVFVSAPSNGSQQKTGGCPICKSEVGKS